MLAIKNMQMPKCCSECNFKYYDEGEDVLCCALEDGYISDEEADEKRLECCPLVEIDERKAGKWIEDGYHNLPCVCSYCGNEGRYDMKFCPNCGAKMEGQE